MFADSLLENHWTNHGRRGWTTLASFALQTLEIAILLMLPLIYTEGIPRLHLVSMSAPLPPPGPPRPPRISHMMEGNLISKVQPVYPSLARQARIQGSVLLRAIISRSGTIRDLNVISGHPMLVGAAIEAVRQWRYRPYILNDEPVEVETQITVNFSLSGG